MEYLSRHLKDIAAVRGDRRLAYLLRKRRSTKKIILTALSKLTTPPPYKNRNDIDEFIENVAFETVSSLRGTDLQFGVYLEIAPTKKEQAIWERAIWDAAVIIAKEFLSSFQTIRRAREHEYDKANRPTDKVKPKE